MTLALRYAVRSDVGLLREGNEDSAYAGPCLLAVADGMGGHAAGEIASAVAISELAQLDADSAGGDLLGVLAKTVTSANQKLHDMVEADPAIGGMGTTLTAMLWSGPRVALCHIGDSRAYMLRDGGFCQITHDHTLVQSLVDDGRISPDEAATHPQRSLLLRALDGSADVAPDLQLRESRPGDRYLLCSDGLSGVVSEDTLHTTLATVGDLDDAVLQLVQLALKGGGPDNITCIVADVVDSSTAAAPPSEGAVLVGAASSGGLPRVPTDSPAGRAHAATQTAPQASIMVHGDQPPPVATRPGDAGEPGAPRRRRWPIVTSVLVLLLAVIAGGGYGGWHYSQSQYYVGTDTGQAVIYRGINQTVAGINLSHIYHRTGIPLAQLPLNDQQSIRGTITATSLAGAERIVSTIRRDYQQCHSAYLAQQAYRTRLAAYHAALKAYKKRTGTTKPVKRHGKSYTPPAAPKHPAPVPASCPAQPPTIGGSS
ncbi:MAG: serine/threonine-protein phosphatase [Actinobacteria bacterium]|nr:serine/threonine-protein phosphatase [Actinomycetota bacterium]